MKRINIRDVQLSDFIKVTGMPEVQWRGTLPSAYSITVIDNAERSKSIVVVSDNFGGGLAWALTSWVYVPDLSKFPISAVIEVIDGLDDSERKFLAQEHPEFLSALNAL